MILRVLGAFMRRDRLNAASYRAQLLIECLSALFTVATFYYISRALAGSFSAAFKDYGGDYFPFVLVGIAFASYQNAGLQATTQRLREEQAQGTLEHVLGAPIPPALCLAGGMQWDMVSATIQAVLYITLAAALFGLKLRAAQIPAVLLVLALAVSAFAGLGAMSAAFAVKFKRGDPVAWLIGSVSELLGGVYFPTGLLPGWLKTVSRLIPTTHALDALRLALLRGAPWAEMRPSILFLAGFSALALPAGIFLFNKALESARREGSLGHY